MKKEGVDHFVFAWHRELMEAICQLSSASAALPRFLPCHPSNNLKILEFSNTQNDLDRANQNNCFNILIFLSTSGLPKVQQVWNGQKEQDVETIIQICPIEVILSVSEFQNL